MVEYYDQLCACGCGSRIRKRPSHKYDGVPKYCKGHWAKSKKGRKIISETSTGRVMSNPFKNMTYEERYGELRAMKIKDQISATETGKIVSSSTRRKMRKSHLGLFTGCKNPNWKGGGWSDAYPDCWTISFTDEIRRRDGFLCQMCGVEQIVGERRFHVHHIDENKENCDPENLITLCPKCHVRVHYPKKEEVYYG